MPERSRGLSKTTKPAYSVFGLSKRSGVHGFVLRTAFLNFSRTGECHRACRNETSVVRLGLTILPGFPLFPFLFFLGVPLAPFRGRHHRLSWVARPRERKFWMSDAWEAASREPLSANITPPSTPIPLPWRGQQKCQGLQLSPTPASFVISPDAPAVPPEIVPFGAAHAAVWHTLFKVWTF